MSHFNGTKHNRPVHFSSRESRTTGRRELPRSFHSPSALLRTACHRFIFNRAPHTMTPGAAHFAALLSCLLLSYHSSSSSSSFLPHLLFSSLFFPFFTLFSFLSNFSLPFFSPLLGGLFVDPFNFRLFARFVRDGRFFLDTFDDFVRACLYGYWLFENFLVRFWWRDMLLMKFTELLENSSNFNRAIKLELINYN